jgi:uncharacterized protein
VRVFVDTSAWCALADSSDRQHSKALSVWHKINEKGDSLITSDYVFDETLTLLRFKLSHSAAVNFGRDLLSSRVCQLVEIGPKLRQKAWNIFVKYSDKKFSFTDCASFAAMDELGLRSAFAFDAHFLHYGFSLLPSK